MRSHSCGQRQPGRPRPPSAGGTCPSCRARRSPRGPRARRRRRRSRRPASRRAGAARSAAARARSVQASRRPRRRAAPARSSPSRPRCSAPRSRTPRPSARSRRAGRGSRSRADQPDRHLGALDPPLDHGRVAEAQGRHDRGGRSASRSTVATPSADPLREGFTTHGSPTTSGTRAIAAPGPEVAQGRSPRSTVPRGGRDPRPRERVLREHLVERDLAVERRRSPCSGSSRRSSRRWTVPSSPSLPCKASQHRSGRRSASASTSGASRGVDEPRLVPELLAVTPSHGDPLAGRRRAPGVRPPASTAILTRRHPPGSGRAAPRPRSSAPSRAMPSRIRSSVG